VGGGQILVAGVFETAVSLDYRLAALHVALRQTIIDR
jgi:hypothetical protein